MVSRYALAVSAALLMTTGTAAAQGSPGTCKQAGSMVRLADLSEASGLAMSRSAAGRLWSHNDSGPPTLFAFDKDGQPAGKLTLTGARVEDWEALAVGPCGNRSCLYVGDIGDNEGKRPHITVYRVPEPAQAVGSARAEALQATYPDGAHDAETLLVAPDGGLFVVTKGDTGPIAVYRFPRNAQPGTASKLEPVGKAIAEKAGENARVTDGAISSDGRWVVLRTKTALTFFPGADFMRGDFGGARRVDLKSIGEPQGEGIAFGAGDTVYVAGEGGGKKQPGTLAVLSCRP
jgi:hypothetical protein